jgi:hypothetical protein
MTGRLTHIWRHPIKSHGREALETVKLRPGETLPWDRAWAVTHENTKADGSTWMPCANFSRVAQVAALQAIEAEFDETREQITLTHPDMPTLTFRPDEAPEGFIPWANKLMPEGRPKSSQLVRARKRGMTDTEFASVSILNVASNSDLGQRLGRDLSLKRWRGNIILDGFEPWEECNWIGKTLQIGSVLFCIREPIGRCQATSVDPQTGRRDMDMVANLRTEFGHTNFGVYATVETAGDVSIGDLAQVVQ